MSAALPRTRGPSLDEIHQWQAAVDIAQAATAFGISKSHAYALLDRGEFPAKAIRVGGRWKVLTASIINVLSGEAPPTARPPPDFRSAAA